MFYWKSGVLTQTASGVPPMRFGHSWHRKASPISSSIGGNSALSNELWLHRLCESQEHRKAPADEADWRADSMARRDWRTKCRRSFRIRPSTDRKLGPQLIQGLGSNQKTDHGTTLSRHDRASLIQAIAMMSPAGWPGQLVAGCRAKPRQQEAAPCAVA